MRILGGFKSINVILTVKPNSLNEKGFILLFFIHKLNIFFLIEEISHYSI